MYLRLTSTENYLEYPMYGRQQAYARNDSNFLSTGKLNLFYD